MKLAGGEGAHNVAHGAAPDGLRRRRLHPDRLRAASAGSARRRRWRTKPWRGASLSSTTPSRRTLRSVPRCSRSPGWPTPLCEFPFAPKRLSFEMTMNHLARDGVGEVAAPGRAGAWHRDRYGGGSWVFAGSRNQGEWARALYDAEFCDDSARPRIKMRATPDGARWKNSLSSAAASLSRTPPTTSGRCRQPGASKMRGAVLHAAAFRVVGAEDQAADAEQAIAAAHIGQGSSVTTRSQSGSRGSPRAAAAARSASSSAWAVASRRSSHAVAGARQHRAVRAEHHRADRHLAARGGGAGFLQRDLHRRHAQPPCPHPACGASKQRMNTRHPVIGVTLDAEPPGGYSKYPWYALRTQLRRGDRRRRRAAAGAAAPARRWPRRFWSASTRWWSPAARSTSIRRCTATPRGTRPSR